MLPFCCDRKTCVLTIPCPIDPFDSWIGEGIFSPLFRTFLRGEIPAYYKIFLTAYLFSYTSGGAYIIVFTIAAVARLLNEESQVSGFSRFNSAGVLILSVVVSILTAWKGCLFGRLFQRVNSPLSFALTGLLCHRIQYLFDSHGSYALEQQEAALPRVPWDHVVLPRVFDDPLLHVLPGTFLLCHGKFLFSRIYGPLDV